MPGVEIDHTQKQEFNFKSCVFTIQQLSHLVDLLIVSYQLKLMATLTEVQPLSQAN